MKARIYFRHGPVDPQNEQRNIEYTEAEVKQALDAASPELAAAGGWNVVRVLLDDDRRLHANFLLARFGVDGDSPAFLRVYVGSANLSMERGYAFGTWWSPVFCVARPACRRG